MGQNSSADWGGIERRTKEGTGKTYKQIAKRKRTFVGETLYKEIIEVGLMMASRPTLYKDLYAGLKI